MNLLKNLSTAFQISAFKFELSIVNCPLSIVHCQLSIVNCELFWLASPNLPRSYLEPSGLLSRIYSIPFGLLSP